MIVGGGRNRIYAHIRIAIEQTDGSKRSKAHKYPSTLNTHFPRVCSLCRRLQKKIGFLFRLEWVLMAGRRVGSEVAMTNGRALSTISTESEHFCIPFNTLWRWVSFHKNWSWLWAMKVMLMKYVTSCNAMLRAFPFITIKPSITQNFYSAIFKICVSIETFEFCLSSELMKLKELRSAVLHPLMMHSSSRERTSINWILCKWNDEPETFARALWKYN